MDIITIVEKLAEFGYIRTNRIAGDYYSIYCPFHNGGNEKKPSFGILLHDIVKGNNTYKAGWCHCFTCAYAKDIVSFITDLFEIKSISIAAIDWLKDNIAGFDIDSFEYLIPQDLLQNLLNKYTVDYIKLQNNDNNTTYISDEELSKYRYIVPYMRERKLTDYVINKFDVGFDANWIPEGRKKPIPCITFPVHDINGKTLFICRRAIEYKFYHYPKGIIKPLYGIDMIEQHMKFVCIVESCINALTLWSWGYPAVALLGTGNNYQLNQLKRLGVHEYIICTDGDDAGYKASKRLKKNLQDCALIFETDIPSGKDVNDLTKEEFDEIFKNRY